MDEPRVFGDWSPSRAVEEMDRDGVATGFASFPLPGGRANLGFGVVRVESHSRLSSGTLMRAALAGATEVHALQPGVRGAGHVCP